MKISKQSVPIVGSPPKSKKIKIWVYSLLVVVGVLVLLTLFPWIHAPRTVQFDASLPYTEINGYKFHTETFGNPEAPAVIAVHGGPGQGYDYMYALKELSNDYYVIFYDQRGAGLSPRVDKKSLTLEQNIEDLDAIINHFSGGKKVKLIGHSWGGMLTSAYLSRYPEKVSQAILIEPAPLSPGKGVREWARGIKSVASIWEAIPYLIAYPYIVKEDGQEQWDYIGTRMSNSGRPGAPYQCEDQKLPPNTFNRFGYETYNNIMAPVINNPDSFKLDLTEGINNYHGDLILIASECSILGYKYQQKYALPKLPSQTIFVKVEHEGHNVLTLNPQWSIQTIMKFFKP